ncbi:malate dehydrogenase, partial [Archaeoglobales archaeon]
ALVRFAEKRGLHEDYVIPHMTEAEVFPEVALAVAKKAMEQGLARLKLSEEEIYEHARQMIMSSESKIRFLMEKGFIPEPPNGLELSADFIVE